MGYVKINNDEDSKSNYTQTATFVDPRRLSYRYLSSPPQSQSIHHGPHHSFPYIPASYSPKTTPKLPPNMNENKNKSSPLPRKRGHSVPSNNGKPTTNQFGENHFNESVLGDIQEQDRESINSRNMSTPTTNTYVYHANAPRMPDVDILDHDPFGIALKGNNVNFNEMHMFKGWITHKIDV